MLLIKHRPGSRQPEQYALEPGLLQIPGQRRAKRSLLQSKVARRDYFDVGSDDRVSDVESACRTTGRKPPVLGRSHGAGALLRLRATARGANGAGVRRGDGAQVVLRLGCRGITT
ncbi:MAG: hypothetical protein QOE74_6031 [Mycobacterium sp.]|jgi:hypothetical protein|nr:hypothetical protein [Mycobacterium sp.]